MAGPRRKPPLPVGARFHRLVVLGEAPLSKWQAASSYFQCDCGNVVALANNRVGRTDGHNQKSCGCWLRERAGNLNLRHGHAAARVDGAASTPTYRSWTAMMTRCFREHAPDYGRYGGRGITVCERWRVFDNFLADMGERPDDTSIDRIDVNGNYEPGNCRWATRIEQARNKRNTAWLTVGEVTKSVAEWTEVTGLTRRSIEARIKAGWPANDVISKPLRATRRSA